MPHATKPSTLYYIGITIFALGDLMAKFKPFHQYLGLLLIYILLFIIVVIGIGRGMDKIYKLYGK